MGEQTEASGFGFETRAIHAGQDPDALTGAVVTPISLATTFAQESVGVHRGYEYSRSGNPTRTALEQCVASLEGRRPWSRLRQRVGRRGHGVAHAQSGRARASRQRRLRRHVPPDRQRVGAARNGVGCRRPHRRRCAGGVVARRHHGGVARIADQSVAQLRRHRSRRRAGPRTGSTSRRRQHVRHAVPPAAAHPRRRRRRPLGDEVPRRAQRRGRRIRRRQRRRTSPTACATSRTPPAPSPPRSTATSSYAA